jgi:D-glycero-D-manno-heptose 1,7-bisphosphate phosphatase
MTGRAVFLDRDGVINRAIIRQGRPFPPANLGDLEIPPGVREALTRLKGAGYALIVVSNQPDVARGKTSRETVDSINRRLAETLPIDEFRVCFHDNKDLCGCRKPKPGLLIDAARERGIDLGQSFMIGDRWRDVEAGAAAGCTTIFIDYGYDERRPAAIDHTVTSLNEAAEIILHMGERKCRPLNN